MHIIIAQGAYLCGQVFSPPVSCALWPNITFFVNVTLHLYSKIYCHVGAEVSVQVLPQGIVSVNGSDVNMGCTSPLVDSGGVMVCNSTDCPSSYLLDGNSPAIDTSIYLGLGISVSDSEKE